MFAHRMKTDLQDWKLKGISSLSFVRTFTAVSLPGLSVTTNLHKNSRQCLTFFGGKKSNICMWVFSAGWKRSERIQCQAWAHLSWKWINSNILRVKEEFHALVTFPDVIYMGAVPVSTELLTWEFFQRKTQLPSPAWHHTENYWGWQHFWVPPAPSFTQDKAGCDSRSHFEVRGGSLSSFANN